ncbi:uncharacterized protein ATNIH1004_006608 [Aspergillus tanneri]|uniref:Uncharacterized protein n=1 Tax=Aspergillus tanneri TaxID=1220188 RepID=A0A5M9MPT7_9EURO|nr:uncharacterized protein ATNIH1004_006608 [Aspergillus tanneri]KAA8647906.1 hypothetical protein ATNIH1004_006608 [Aspergillus tanneri]
MSFIMDTSATSVRTILSRAEPGRWIIPFQRRFAQLISRTHLKQRAGHASKLTGIYNQATIFRRESNALKEKGIMSWYGTQEPRSPDTRTLSEVLEFQSGVGGDFLVSYPYCGGSGASVPMFKLPEGLQAGSLYTVYWLWKQHIGESPMAVFRIAPSATPSSSTQDQVLWRLRLRDWYYASSALASQEPEEPYSTGFQFILTWLSQASLE